MASNPYLEQARQARALLSPDYAGAWAGNADQVRAAVAQLREMREQHPLGWRFMLDVILEARGVAAHPEDWARCMLIGRQIGAHHIEEAAARSIEQLVGPTRPTPRRREAPWRMTEDSGP